jgi:hypothetical protein
MEASMLSGLVAVEPALAKAQDEELYRPLTAPPKTVPRTPIGTSQRKSFELHDIPIRDGRTRDASSVNASNDLEMSRPNTPDSNTEVVEVLPTFWNPFMNRFRVLFGCLAQLGNALSDGAAGALIPYMEKYVDKI